MSTVRFGEPVQGVRFGLTQPSGQLTAGGPIAVELVVENHGLTPVWLYGFKTGYPRSLRVSPPKPDRPWVRVSFSDVNVLHPPDAFVRMAPGERQTTWLDLSFAFDRRGVGVFPIAFAYEPVRAMGGMRAFTPPAPATTGQIELSIERAAALREAGIDERAEGELDALLLTGDPSALERLRALGPGGATYAARRVARVLGAPTETILGWKALDALEVLGPTGLTAVRAASQDMPHAARALEFAEDWLSFRSGATTSAEHLPFVTELEQLIQQPDRRGNFVLSWTAYDSPIHGSSRVEVFGNGDRIVGVRPPGHAVPSTRRTMLGPMQTKGLLETLLWSGCWLLRPLRLHGAPDEPRPALEIQLALGDQFARKVAMWNGEWRQGPGFRLADMLDRLAAAVRPESLAPLR